MTQPTLRYRGIIEGFLGPMWSHEERLHLLRHLRGWNMNLYIYSPRHDPYLSSHWDRPYPPAEARRFAELARAARGQRVQFAYAISPGRTFQPQNPAHRRALLDKLGRFIDLGCTFFPILYDDRIHDFAPEAVEGVGHAERQARLMNELAEAITARCPGAHFLFCPTHYATAAKLPYLCRLHELLDPRIETAVTGVDRECSGLCPRTFSDAGARRYFDNFGRRPFFWDNFNVHDRAVNALHWTPYMGRGAHLDQLCSGIVLNPQNVYLFNLPIFGCLGDYFADPRRYNPRASFRRHIAELMGAEAAPLGLILSKWFTAEWSDYRSSEENLPPLGGQRLTGSARARRLTALEEILSPLLDLGGQFSRTCMDPQLATRLLPFAVALQRYAEGMIAYGKAVRGRGPVSRTAAAVLRKHVDGLEKYYYRLPASLIDYARRLAGDEIERKKKR